MNIYLFKYKSRDGKRILSARIPGDCVWHALRQMPVHFKRRVVEIWHADELVPYEELHS